MSEESNDSAARDDVLRVGQVRKKVGCQPQYVVVDAVGEEIEPISEFLRHMSVMGARETTQRAYAHALLKWWRFLAGSRVNWLHADSTVFGAFVLWSKEPRRLPDGRQAGARHSRATINQSGSVISRFYDFHLRAGSGPRVNPTVWAPTAVRRRRSPLLPARRDERLFGRQRLVTRVGRDIPERDLERIRNSLRSPRDRAIVDVLLGSAARATEVLNMRAMDVDRQNALVRVLRKGGLEWQWVPCAPAALESLSEYLRNRRMAPSDRIWLSERAPFQPLTYDALRRTFERAQAGSDLRYTLHQLRHTAAQRMANDPQMPLPHVQRILGHRSILTTQLYVGTTTERAIESAAEHHRRRSEAPSQEPSRPIRYDASSLRKLFGESDE